MKSLPLLTATALALAAGAAFFTTQAADAPADRASAETAKPTTGLQLYSLRSQFKLRGVAWTLDRVKEFGIKEVELAGTYDQTPEQFRAELDKRDLLPVSGHFPFGRLKGDLEAVVKEAKILGLKYAGCAWIDHKDTFDEAECRLAAEVFNKAGEAFNKEGITFFYHPHGYEFQPHGNGTLFDLLFAETKPELVSYQMDVLWIVFPGKDPVKLLNQYSNRWKLMHLKDLKKGVATGSLAGKTDVDNDVVLGSGQTDYPAVLEAARKVGVKHYFIEDESSSVMEQVPQSLQYMKTQGFE